MHWKVESSSVEGKPFEEEVRAHSGLAGTVLECVDVKGRDHWNVECTDGSSSRWAKVNVTYRG